MNVDDIIRYETGELTERETIELFAQGIQEGWVWNLQGHYGRMAHSLIQNEVISPDGLTIYWQFI